MAKFKFYTIWLVLICLIVFVLQNLISGFTDMFILNKSAVSGEYWRFLTSIFLHGSLTHLAYNMFALLFFGFALERLIGSRRFIIIFFFSGIIANLISVNFYDSSLGASGAIMGIIGALTIIKPFMLVWAFGLILPMFIAAILWIIGDVVGVFMPSGVGNIAHLSGIAIGFLIGLILRGKKKIRKAREKISIPDNYIKLWEDSYMK